MSDKNQSAIDRLSKSIEDGIDHALMSDEEWEADTIERMKRLKEKQRQSK